MLTLYLGPQTTALISHTIYFFAIHPDVLRKAREEILDVLGPEGAPTVEKMRGLKYCESQTKFYSEGFLTASSSSSRFERDTPSLQPSSFEHP